MAINDNEKCPHCSGLTKEIRLVRCLGKCSKLCDYYFDSSIYNDKVSINKEVFITKEYKVVAEYLIKYIVFSQLVLVGTSNIQTWKEFYSCNFYKFKDITPENVYSIIQKHLKLTLLK